MPNIIVIDSDNRTANQITASLNDLKASKVRRFNDLQTFRDAYFKNVKVESTKGHLEEIENFRFVNATQRQWILKSKFTEKAVLPGPQITIRSMYPVHFVDHWTPEITESITVIGFGKKELAESKHIFVERVAEPFQKDFEEYINSCSLGSQTERLFCFKLRNTRYCALQVSGAPGPNNTVILNFRDVNVEFYQTLEEERKRIASLKKEMDELKLLKTIDIMVIRNSTLGDNIQESLQGLLQGVEDFGYKPDFRTQVIIVKYEDDGIQKVDYAIPEVDALVFYPIDHAIFLQTIEILSELPEKADPSYLFNQKVDGIEIDICKSASLHSINEFCIAVENPAPIANGILAHFYLKLGKEEVRVTGKVFKTIANPDNPQNFLVFFAFFGLEAKSLVTIRKYLDEGQKFEVLKNNKRSEFRFDEKSSNYKVSEIMPKTAAVVMVDEEQRNKLRMILSEDFDRIQCIQALTLHELITKYLPAQEGGGGKIKAADAEDFPIEDVWWTYNKSTHMLEEADERVKVQAQDMFMGYPVKELFSRTDNWKRLLGSSEIILLKEITRVISSERQKHVIEFQHAMGGSRVVVVNFSLDEGSQNLIRVQARTPKTAEYKEYLTPPEAIGQLDAIFVDTKTVGPDIQTWISELDEILAGRKLTNDKPQVYLNTSKFESSKVRSYGELPRVSGLFHPGTDLRHIQFCVAQTMNNRFNMHSFFNLNFREPKMGIHVAKPVPVLQVSEYGASIRHPKPFSYGAYLYLRGELFSEAPDSSLLARFYHNEKDEEFSDQFSSSLIFFGLNEVFLKSLRKWFIELHVEANKDSN